MRGVDLNHRPLGYEPNELPDCSTPQLHPSVRQSEEQLSMTNVTKSSNLAFRPASSRPPMRQRLLQSQRLSCIERISSQSVIPSISRILLAFTPQNARSRRRPSPSCIVRRGIQPVGIQLPACVQFTITFRLPLCVRRSFANTNSASDPIDNRVSKPGQLPRCTHLENRFAREWFSS